MEDNNVDNTKNVVRAVEWFYGYGGNALGLRRAIPGLREVAKCERDAFVVANMVSKMEKGLMDSVPIWTDCKTFPIEPFKDRVDIFIASYPCQGFSSAGKRLGAEDERHLWPYCRKFIVGARPAWVWLENVEGHVTLGLSTVLSDLEEDGYTAAWGIFSASEVGAPHQRKRVFILAYDKRGGMCGMGSGVKSRCELKRIFCGEGEWGQIRSETEGCGREDVAQQQQQQGLEGHTGDVNAEERQPEGEDRPTAEGSLSGTAWPSRPGQQQYGWEPPRVTNGVCLADSKGSIVINGQFRKADIEQTGNMGDLGNTICDGLQENGDIRSEKQSGWIKSESSENGRDTDVESPLGGNPDGPADGLDLSGYTGLSDSELAAMGEVEEWLTRGTNRTDELRMCGNGVVPQTAERAFRTLYRELSGN